MVERIGGVGIAAGFLAAMGLSYIAGYSRGSSTYDKRGIQIKPLAVEDLDGDQRPEVIYRIRSGQKGLATVVCINGRSFEINDGKYILTEFDRMDVEGQHPDYVDCDVNFRDCGGGRKKPVISWKITRMGNLAR